MLKQTEHTETPATNAASVRVTPEELAAALAHLDAGRAGQDGRIAIGKAVEELSLDAAPEDILRAVEVARQQGARRRRRKQQKWFTLAAVLAVVTPSSFILYQRTHTATLPRPASFASLETVGDEQQAYVDMRGLKQIMDGIPVSQIRVYPHSEGIRWGIIKHNDQIYVQAYTPTVTEQSLKTHPFDIYNVENADLNGTNKGMIYLGDGNYANDVKVTLPIEKFHCRDTQQMELQAKVTVADAHTDDHLWDDFEHNH